MNDLATAQVLRNLDERTSRIEQRLHSFPTREEMNEAIRVGVEPLATREELRAAIEPLATREELRAAIEPLATREELRAAVEPLATREELRAAGEPLATREELRTGIEEVKRHTRILFESVRDDIRLLAEQVVGLMNRPRG